MQSKEHLKIISCMNRRMTERPQENGTSYRSKKWSRWKGNRTSVTECVTSHLTCRKSQLGGPENAKCSTIAGMSAARSMARLVVVVALIHNLKVMCEGKEAQCSSIVLHKLKVCPASLALRGLWNSNVTRHLNDGALDQQQHETKNSP